jgi:hypothetical protein
MTYVLILRVLEVKSSPEIATGRVGIVMRSDAEKIKRGWPSSLIARISHNYYYRSTEVKMKLIKIIL